MENHARYGELIYTHTADTLSVNLFIASELDWPEHGFALRQDTGFPAEAGTTLTITKATAEPVTLRVRHPFWVDAGKLVVTLNEQAVTATFAPDGFAEIRRSWQAGDRVCVALPMKLRVVRQAQCPGWVSVFNGPILLAGELGSSGLQQKDYIGPYTPIKALRPLNRVPLLVATSDAEVLARIAPVPGRPGVFRTHDLAKPNDVTLAPFHDLHFQRYAIYWQLSDPTRAAELQRQVAEAERREQELEANTIDRVRLGEQQPETDHRLLFEKSRTGYGPLGRHFRAAEDGGWFSFEMKLPPAGGKSALRFVYWGRDNGPEFDLQLDGTVIGKAKAEATGEEDYYGVEYPIPAALLEAKDKVVVRIQTKPGKPTPAIYDLRIVRTK